MPDSDAKPNAIGNPDAHTQAVEFAKPLRHDLTGAIADAQPLPQSVSEPRTCSGSHGHSAAGGCTSLAG